ncbi:DoxX family protein [Stenotrophomonas maltophilia]|jgi:uncharacterized membrane protein YphA (DoxX/SURF4 family)|nr:DoxX family protein [Stenotrophomonas maltophilia]MBH1796968.1 DoxX family protein [Stenotrophomonas maltophilia]
MSSRKISLIRLGENSTSDERFFQGGLPPLYLMKILGFAKILGGAAILYGKFPRLKEWAYAGFAFDYLGAAASHVFANDSVNAIPPLVFFGIMMGTYYLWYKTQATPTP